MDTIPDARQRRLATQARYRAKHAQALREKGRARMRAAYLADPEKYRAVAQKWRDNHHAEHSENQKRYKAANPDIVRRTQHRYAATHTEQIKDRKRRYRQAHPDSSAICEARRRARRRKVGGSLSSSDWQEIKAASGYRCLCCGRQEPEIKLTIDHVIPLSKGGRHSKENVQPLCSHCNFSKQTKHIDYRLIQSPNSS